MQIRLHKLVSLANTVLKHACVLSRLCILHYSIDIYLPSLLQCCSTGTCLPLGLASLLSPPSSLCRSLASISIAAASHEARWVTATHPHRRTQPFSAALFKRGPLDPSATQPPTDGSCGNLEKLSNVTLTHEERNLNEEENELLVAHWKLANSYCITQCVICKNKLQGTLVDGLEIR